MIGITKDILRCLFYVLCLFALLDQKRKCWNSWLARTQYGVYVAKMFLLHLIFLLSRRSMTWEVGIVRSLTSSPVSGLVSLFCYLPPSSMHSWVWLRHCVRSGCWVHWRLLQSKWEWQSLLFLPFSFSKVWGANVPFQLPWGWIHHCLHLFIGVLLNKFFCERWPSFALPKGGGGALAREYISLYPNSTVTIYDLPKVVQVAKQRFVPPEEHRIAFHEGRCRQWGIVVTAIAPEPLSLLRGTILEAQVSSCPLYGQCVLDCSLSSLGLWFIATTRLSRLCITDMMWLILFNNPEALYSWTELLDFFRTLVLK